MGQPGQTAPPADTAAGALSLVFRAGQLLCALRLDEVIETMRPLAVRPLAGTPAFVRGVTIMRGVPTPVVDVARLLGGEQAEVARFVAVRTERGPVAFATGTVLGIRPATADTGARHATLIGSSGALVAGVGTLDAEPLLLLQSMRVVPDEVWVAAAGGSACPPAVRWPGSGRCSRGGSAGPSPTAISASSPPCWTGAREPGGTPPAPTWPG
jgi:purine-binding chemotaxis protein CheW